MFSLVSPILVLGNQALSLFKLNVGPLHLVPTSFCNVAVNDIFAVLLGLCYTCWQRVGLFWSPLSNSMRPHIFKFRRFSTISYICSVYWLCLAIDGTIPVFFWIQREFLAVHSWQFVYLPIWEFSVWIWTSILHILLCTIEINIYFVGFLSTGTFAIRYNRKNNFYLDGHTRSRQASILESILCTNTRYSVKCFFFFFETNFIVSNNVAIILHYVLSFYLSF